MLWNSTVSYERPHGRETIKCHVCCKAFARRRKHLKCCTSVDSVTKVSVTPATCSDINVVCTATKLMNWSRMRLFKCTVCGKGFMWPDLVVFGSNEKRYSRPLWTKVSLTLAFCSCTNVVYITVDHISDRGCHIDHITVHVDHVAVHWCKAVLT